MPQKPRPPFSLTEKIAELEAIEAYFNRPDMDVDEALRKHAQAVALAKEVVAYLRTAESSIKAVDLEMPLTGAEGSSLEG